MAFWMRRCCCRDPEIFVATSAAGGGRLYGLTRAGVVVWTLNTGSGFTTDFGGKMSMDDTLIYVPMVRNSTWEGASGNASILAVSRETGEVEWSYDTGGTATATFAVGDGTVIVLGGAGLGLGVQVWKLDDTGAAVWNAADYLNGRDLTCDQNGNVFVAGSGSPNMAKWSAAGAFLASGTFGSVWSSIDSDTGGILYVAGDPGGDLPTFRTINNTLTASTTSLEVPTVAGATTAFTTRSRNGFANQALVTASFDGGAGTNTLYLVSAGAIIDAMKAGPTTNADALALSTEPADKAEAVATEIQTYHASTTYSLSRPSTIDGDPAITVSTIAQGSVNATATALAAAWNASTDAALTPYTAWANGAVVFIVNDTPGSPVTDTTSLASGGTGTMRVITIIDTYAYVGDNQSTGGDIPANKNLVKIALAWNRMCAVWGKVISDAATPTAAVVYVVAEKHPNCA